MAKIIIAGCRWFTPDEEDIGLTLIESGYHADEIVSNGVMGVGQAGEDWAKERSIPCHIFKATFGKLHATNRAKQSAEIANYADVLVAWWDGHSVITGDLIQRMIALGKPVWIEMIREDP
jgi:hypothetical protein